MSIKKTNFNGQRFETDLADFHNESQERWQKTERVAKINARYEIACEMRKLCKKYSKYSEHRQRIIDGLHRTPGRESSAHQTIFVGERVPKKVVSQACKTVPNTRMQTTWSHLVEVAIVVDHEDQLSLIKESQQKRWSSKKLKAAIESGYDITGGREMRFTVVCTSLRNFLAKLDALSVQMMRNDPQRKAAYLEAAYRVKRNQSLKALTVLSEARQNFEVLLAKKASMDAAFSEAKNILLAEFSEVEKQKLKKQVRESTARRARSKTTSGTE